jgi:hypothetical protein
MLLHAQTLEFGFVNEFCWPVEWTDDGTGLASGIPAYPPR